MSGQVKSSRSADWRLADSLQAGLGCEEQRTWLHVVASGLLWVPHLQWGHISHLPHRPALHCSLCPGYQTLPASLSS